MQIFYDDFRMLDLASCNGSVFKWFKHACKVLGWTFGPEKDHPPAVQLPRLGHIEDWSCTQTEDVLIVKPKPERIKDVRDTITKILTDRHCPKGAAASLIGRILHIAGASQGKVGRSNHYHLGLYADGVLSAWSDLLENELVFCFMI